MGLMTGIPESLAAFTKWLASHPVAGDQPYSCLGVR
jgi:hypothetical protein